GEEEKSEKEPLKIWGQLDEAKGEIVPATSPVITSQCIRVPILYGHTATVFVKFKQNPTKEELVAALESYQGLPQS
ncbi:MAG: Asd/ArgC dimerization domain-containing protein, partial [Ligilactobacillus agilis]|nr:Asd/ArgC dimerization domain-containing protein [Ligilactobacillus agilis]